MGKTFKIRAEVTADVELTIEAHDQEAALAQFYASIMLTAGLTDVKPDTFMIIEDSISEVGPVSIEQEDE